MGIDDDGNREMYMSRDGNGDKSGRFKVNR